MQDNSIELNKSQKKILDLEKKYFSKIESIIKSDAFTNDLLRIEEEIRSNYGKLEKIWKVKNKLKIPAERLIRHYTYMQLNQEIKGIYPSPISSDLGLRFDDCVLCIDVKTIDTDGNSSDISTIQVEPNQISFNNKKYSYVPTVSNLEAFDNYLELPVLTYIVEIIYWDNNERFSLSRDKYPSIIIANIPNGKLSNLFGDNIIKGFKTYTYYSEKDGIEFAPHVIPEEYLSEDKLNQYVEEYCVNERKFVKDNTNKNKVIYTDSKERVNWFLVNTKDKGKTIKALKNGATARISKDTLKKRYDSKNNQWEGYVEFKVKEALNVKK